VSRKPSVQECRKRFDARCFLCGETHYTLLDAHRIFPGELGGVYHWDNLLTLCSNCHRKVTAKLVVVHRRMRGSGGTYIAWRDEAGHEHITPETRP
jgi:5-methylcytosine-specific restriction endonuclease McrA